MENEKKICEIIEVKTAESLAVRIRTTVQQTQKIMLDAAISIGQDLIDAKELVSHGEWEDWLENAVGFSQSTANKYMQISREYGTGPKSELIPILNYSKALKLLAVPEEDLEGFVQDNDVEGMTVKELEEKIKDLQKRNEAFEKDIEEIEKVRSEKEEIIREKIKADEKTEKLEKKLEQLRTDHQSILSKEIGKAKQEAADQAKKDAEAETQKLMDMVDLATKAKQEAEKKLAASANESLMRFKLAIDQFQLVFNDAMESLARIEASEQEHGSQLRKALRAILDQMKERI